MVTTRADVWSGTTARARRFESPPREFLRTESGGAAVLLAATAAALVWVNVDAASYQDLWDAVLAIDLGGEGVELTRREWVNSGLMTFFFFVLGLAARVRPRRLSRAAAVRAPVAGVDRRHRRGRSSSRSTSGARPPRAGASQCRRTRRSRWDCCPCSAGALRTACGRSCLTVVIADDLL